MLSCIIPNLTESINMKTSFLNLPIGAHFNFNSNEYIKKSTRTAFLIEFNRVFYFSNSELVKIINLA